MMAKDTSPMSATAPKSKMEGAMERALRKLTIVAGAGVLLLVGGIGTWASIMTISGAVIADGRTVVESSPKAVQHREGGIVAEIVVKDGDRVEAGQLLVRLDDTFPRTELAVVEKRLVHLLVKAARLTADFTGARMIGEPEAWHGLAAHPDIDFTMRQEQELLDALRARRSAQRRQLEQRHEQLEEESRGLQAEKASAEKQLSLITEELTGVLQLAAEGFVAKSRVVAMQSTAADLQGQVGRSAAAAAGVIERMNSTAIDIILIDKTARAEALGERRKVDGEILGLLEKRYAAQDALARSAIKAPRTGTVRAMSVHTIGGVVGPGDTIMTIVPSEDRMVVEARVAPTDIDQLHIGQTAVVRFPGLDPKLTPQIDGEVIHIDADLTEPQGMSPPFYIVRVSVDPSTINDPSRLTLLLGMPAQVFFETTPRTPLSFILQPLTDQIGRAFREG